MHSREGRATRGAGQQIGRGLQWLKAFSVVNVLDQRLPSKSEVPSHGATLV